MMLRIRCLEEMLGAPFFLKRSRDGARLTDAGWATVSSLLWQPVRAHKSCRGCS
jgi:hypothetical protein